MSDTPTLAERTERKRLADRMVAGVPLVAREIADMLCVLPRLLTALSRAESDRDRYRRDLPYVLRPLAGGGFSVWLVNGTDSHIGDVPAGLSDMDAHAHAMPLVWARLEADDAQDRAHLARVEGERDHLRSFGADAAEYMREWQERHDAAIGERDTARAESDRLRSIRDDLTLDHGRQHAKLRAQASEMQRLRDLVRHQRGPLHESGLITDAEYAALAGDHGAVARLEGYDTALARVRELEAEVAALRGSPS